jgi:hypothetical protein
MLGAPPDVVALDQLHLGFTHWAKPHFAFFHQPFISPEGAVSDAALQVHTRIENVPVRGYRCRRPDGQDGARCQAHYTLGDTPHESVGAKICRIAMVISSTVTIDTCLKQKLTSLLIAHSECAHRGLLLSSPAVIGWIAIFLLFHGRQTAVFTKARHQTFNNV